MDLFDRSSGFIGEVVLLSSQTDHLVACQVHHMEG